MRRAIVKCGPERGSYLPVLMKALAITTGPVLELGSGMYSTPYLHWACLPTNRTLVTYEGQQAWMWFAQPFAADFHTVRHVPDWQALDVSGPWSVVLVDHDYPRGPIMERLAHAEYLVCHDSERPGKCGYDVAFPRFTYQKQYRDAGRPYTTVVSNVHDLQGFVIP